jgi:hypothetical protein
VSRGDPVDGIRIVGNLGAAARQLIPKSYRPRSRGQRGRRQRRDPLRERLGSGHERLPESLAGGRVEGGEGLAAAGVEHGKAIALGLGARGGGALGKGATQRIERADAARRQAGAGGEAARGGDADADADEGARPEPDRDPVDRAPATGRGDGPLDLGEQRGRVARAAVGREAEQLLVQDLAAARRADGGVGGRRIEADDRPRR